MLDRLIEFFLDFLDKALPFWILKDYEGGVKLTFGKYAKTLVPGFYWKVPFVDEIISCSVVTTTLSIPVQSLTTRCQKQIAVKGVVKYHIDDAKPFLLEIYDSKDAISDVTQSIIKKQIHNRTWEQCNEEDIDNEITKKLRNEVKRWGINIENVTLTDMGIIRSIRLFNEQPPKEY